MHLNWMRIEISGGLTDTTLKFRVPRTMVKFLTTEATLSSRTRISLCVVICAIMRSEGFLKLNLTTSLITKSSDVPEGGRQDDPQTFSNEEYVVSSQHEAFYQVPAHNQRRT
jgi:hypothetical protein